jgi:hypothetical protein
MASILCEKTNFSSFFLIIAVSNPSTGRNHPTTGVAAVLKRHRLLLEIVIDDQDHTHDLLKSGDVMGCVSALAEPMRGCVAEPLGA